LVGKQTRKGQRRPARQRLRAKEKEVLGMWEGGVERIGRLLAEAKAMAKPAPGEKVEAILKREVYLLVNELSDRRYRTDFENVLIYKMESAPRLSFDSNPYYWALKAIWKDDEIGLKGSVISKYAKQLAYAARHNIPPELLIGFLYQVGGITKIANNLNSGSYEKWYRSNLPWTGPA
jgi:hypothetical protein